MPERETGLLLAVQAAGGFSALARVLGISPQGLWQWERVPAERLLQVEAVTKIPREKLRPDLYRRAREGSTAGDNSVRAGQPAPKS